MDASDSEPQPESQAMPKPVPEPRVAAANSAGTKRKLEDGVTNTPSQLTHALPKKPKMAMSDDLPAICGLPTWASHLPFTPAQQPADTEMADSEHPSSSTSTMKPTIETYPPAGYQPCKNPPGHPSIPADKPPRRPTEIMPAQVWQQIFLYQSPAQLSRFLRVCKNFNALLMDTEASTTQGKHSKETIVKAKKSKAALTATEAINFQEKRFQLKGIKLMDSNAVWTRARKIWFPNLPRPLGGFTELQMLQLIGGGKCQFCEIVSTHSFTSALKAGPGPSGMRVIWPFKIRTCGACLDIMVLKDIEILQSTAASLRAGLPYIFLTADWNYIPESLRQTPGGVPPSERLSKVYLNQDKEKVVSLFRQAQDLGEGAADEWKKGLHSMGKEAMNDAARWEKWESQLPLGTTPAEILMEYDLASFPKRVEEVVWLADLDKYAPSGATEQGKNATHSIPVNQPAPYYHQIPSAAMDSTQTSHNPPGNRPPRDAEGAEERRQLRKQDIERRCMDLDPPVEPRVLQFMQSFRNAMQISQPMTDQAWEVLKPRILVQRLAAESAAELAAEQSHARAEQWAALQAGIISHADETYTKPAKELYDKDYEAQQEPLRARLGEYVDHFIHRAWGSQPKLDERTAPKFAVQIITQVYQNYLMDKLYGRLPPAPRATKVISKNGAPASEPFLSLDNMKWVVDNKIKPMTDPHRRELFVCAGCDGDAAMKFFAFEGLVQHYGAKHTDAFTRGNVVVHWQTSEWPEMPPFRPDPERYIKPSRKPYHKSAQGRARNTPQASRDAPFYPPPQRLSLPENPYFADQPPGTSFGNGYHGGAYGYPPSYGQSNHQAAPYRSDQAVPSQQQDPDFNDIDRTNKFAADITEIWNALGGVDEKQMLECIRVQSTLANAVLRFFSKYQDVPSLDMFAEALHINPGLAEVKKVKGLACKNCVANQTDGSASYQSYYARIRNVKLYTVSTITNHYKIAHAAEAAVRNVGWTRDLFELPEMQIVSDLVRAPGMDDEKLGLVAMTFPSAFPDPLPSIEVLQEQTAAAGGDGNKDLASKLMERYTKKPKNHGKKKGGHGTGPQGTRVGSQELVKSEPQEHEYDPRQPMRGSKEKEPEADASRFDTDLARPRVAPAPAHPLGLTPETLRAIQSLGISQTPVQQQSQHDAPAPRRAERSPSVGRVESARPSGSSASNEVQPDIAAILASLTAQPEQQPRPETHSYEGRDSRAVRRDLLPGEPRFEPPPSRAAYAQGPAPWDRQPVPRPSAEPATPARYEGPGADLHAAIERNARASSYNAGPPSAASPPRVHFLDEGQPAPVQYFSRPQPPQGYLQQGYAPQAYHPPAQQPMRWVDQHGNEVHLVPVEAAPVPHQYLPVPQYPPRANGYAAHGQGNGYAPGYGPQGADGGWYEGGLPGPQMPQGRYGEGR